MMVLRVRRSSCLCNYGIRMKKERRRQHSQDSKGPARYYYTEVVCGETFTSLFRYDPRLLLGSLMLNIFPQSLHLNQQGMSVLLKRRDDSNGAYQRYSYERVLHCADSWSRKA